MLARQIVNPLESIARRADAVRVPLVGQPLPTGRGGVEIDRLAQTLNATFGRLHDAWVREARLTADISHELRTPLAVIQTQAEVTLRRERSPVAYRDALTAILNAAQRMTDAVEGLLLLARADTGAPIPMETVDIADLVASTLESVRELQATRTIRVEVQAGITVQGDGRLLEVLLRNLLTNALRHTSANGTLAISAVALSSAVQLTVGDNGEGIPAEALPHIFERFYRADPARSRSRGGTGLGLSIVKAIAQQHGGSVAATSQLGHGTQVVVTLPR